VARYRDLLPAGSYLAVSHAAATEDTHAPAGTDQAATTYSHTVTPFTQRTRAQVTNLLTGFDLVQPGVVYAADWHPEPDPNPQRRLPQLVAMGRKP
jgi:hypothetical protein